MIRKIERTWFEVWGNEQAQNKILKGFLLLLSTLLVIESASLTILSLRKPILIAVSQDKSQAFTATQPTQEVVQAEIKRVVTGYMQSHYNWEIDKIENSIVMAAKYVHPDFVKRFNEANQEQIKIAKEKKISQHFYLRNLTLEQGSARIDGDRILIVESLRATSPLSMTITYSLGARTENNPEGIYITGEKIINN